MGSKAMPRTSADRKMGIKHLQLTRDLEKRKIADHKKAAQAAKKVGDKGSYQYNVSHQKGHEKDLKERSKTIKKYLKAKVKAAKK
jgi:hypothetical protein